MQNEDKDTIQYKARCFKDKSIIPQIEEELRVLVQVILGDKRTLEITHYKDVTYGDGETRKFNPYVYCKDSSHAYCPCKPTNYKGEIKELGYIFYGDSRTAIYCDIIKRFIGEPRVMIPFSY